MTYTESRLANGLEVGSSHPTAAEAHATARRELPPGFMYEIWPKKNGSSVAWRAIPSMQQLDVASPDPELSQGYCVFGGRYRA